MRRTRRSAARAGLVGVVVSTLVVAACGISAESTPREINDAAGVATESSLPESVTGQIFLVRPGATGAEPRLVPLARDLGSDPAAIFEVLLAGATPDEGAGGTYTVLPAGLAANSAELRSGVVELDVNGELSRLGGPQLVLALAQIVHTFDQLSGVDGVRLTVDGVPTGWPDVNGTEQTDVLTVFDYPGLLRSTQPEFPATPNG